MKLRALSVLTAVLVFACQADVEEPLKEVRYEGSIDHEFQAFLRELDGLKVRITLTSSGGRVEDALDAAELAAKNSWKLRIQSICYSSCAEIFVLAFDEIELLPGAFLAFHGNSKMKNAIYNRASGDDESQCFLQHETRREKLIVKAAVQPDFWKYQMDVLQPYDSWLEPKSSSDCALLHYKTKFGMWIPSTEQLRELYGLSFTGTQVTDDPMTAQVFAQVFSGKSAGIVIGETEFLSSSTQPDWGRGTYQSKNN